MINLSARLDALTPSVLSLVRIVFGFLFTAFGTSKMFGWPIAMTMPTGSWPGWYAGLIELVAGLLITFGLFTRAAAFLSSGTMAVAYFWQHQPMGLWPIVPPEYGGNGGLSPILFCFMFFLLVFTGPGPYSLDGLRTRTVEK